MQFDAKNKWDNAPLEKVTLSHFNKVRTGITVVHKEHGVFEAVIGSEAGEQIFLIRDRV